MRHSPREIVYSKRRKEARDNAYYTARRQEGLRERRETQKEAEAAQRQSKKITKQLQESVRLL
jgi:hypothetical protein